MSNRIRNTILDNAVFLYWIITDNGRRCEICDKLGLSRMLTVNKKTVVTNMTHRLYEQLISLQDQEILTITLRP